MGVKISRTQIELTEAEIEKIAGIYHSWRAGDGSFVPEPGFCAVATLDEITERKFALNPGRYTGAAETEDLDEEPFPERLERLLVDVDKQLTEGAALDAQIKEKLSALRGL
jgi:type I restriction enzyme M protein